MALSKRDTNILYLIVGLMGAYVLWSVGVEPVYKNYQELNEDLEKEQITFEENQETLKKAAEIEAGYKRVEAQFPQDDKEGRDPSEVFSEEVVKEVTNIVNRAPDIDPPKTEELKGVSGYQFLVLPMAVKGELKQISAMLKAFDQKGYLVRTAVLSRETNLDKTEITAEINLVRIVKIEEEESSESGPKPAGSIKIGGRR